MPRTSSILTPLRDKSDTEHFAEIDAHLPTRPIHGSGPVKETESTDRVAYGPDLTFLARSELPGALGRLDHYEVLEVRGQGGFGIVLKAFDEKLRRVVALKVLSATLVASEMARKRFLREAQAAAAVQNEHVVGIFAVEDGPTPYIVMEYIDGPSLQEKIDGAGPLPLDEILRIGHQTACGLAAAHHQGLIHRDIKPGNILLENGVARVKITDFGLARAVDDASLSQAGVVCGTPAYMAPEQAAEAKVDHRADLFSLGSVLYTLATGRLPYQASSALAVLRRVVDESPRPMRESRPDLPQWFEALVARLHEKKPSRRYQTAREVADVLAQHLAALKAQGSTYMPAPAPRHAKRWPGAILVCLVVAFAGREGWRAASKPAAPEPGDQVKVESSAASAPSAAVVPFDSLQALRHQTVWGQNLQTPVEQANSIGMTLRLVPPGEFIMGEPAHVVRITQPYYLGAHEVTVAQFRAFVDATGYKTDAENDPQGGAVWNSVKRMRENRPDIHWRTPGFPQTDQHPVCCVSWNDASAFCKWLAKHEGKPYRLPTEAEWEFACRAGTTTAFHYGPVGNLMQMSMNVRSTTPVGEFSPNAFGMYDMHGNVYEWCFDAKRAFRAETAIDPRGPEDGPERAIRGGGYSSGPSSLLVRSNGRGSAKVNDAYSSFGFRVALDYR